jgi:hypothetical protein
MQPPGRRGNRCVDPGSRKHSRFLAALVSALQSSRSRQGPETVMQSSYLSRPDLGLGHRSIMAGRSSVPVERPKDSAGGAGPPRPRRPQALAEETSNAGRARCLPIPLPFACNPGRRHSA